MRLYLVQHPILKACALSSTSIYELFYSLIWREILYPEHQSQGFSSPETLSAYSDTEMVPSLLGKIILIKNQLQDLA
ncbi:MAG: hypothetical protein ACI9RO_001963 [Alteromonas macleodii]|jgi:hypothetical protein